MYATLRSSVEDMNGFVKDGAREAIDDPERRRIRGRAAQSVFVALLICAANLRKIGEWLVNPAGRGKEGQAAPVSTPHEVVDDLGSGWSVSGKRSTTSRRPRPTPHRLSGSASD